jgi:hypothetical protein
VTLRSSTLEANYPAQITDQDGYWTITANGVPDGAYNWRVKGPKYLANSGTLVIRSPLYNMGGFMRAGDCNNDNVVSSVDFSILKGTFGKSSGQPGYDDRAEFTGDLVVNALDFNILRSNFGTGGAPPIGP